ncbi:uncharacterized protein LOC124311236 isoform X2 [Daphnia pulicaria]|uniref:uncharacterized protein LOC124311236 isoform X2 n=1 Tax=Daphnia pulicaria TaxID=35523 RepID=UPI001EEA1968|nr:uncharacterized protein LOC124311236 isoform X2 [Daphnia pulicaria]
MSNRPSTAATGAAAFYPRDLLNDRQVKSWGNVPRENLRDLLDRIQLKRQSGAAVPCSTTTTPFFASDWKTSILMVMGCLLLAQQATYSPFIWRAGSALISTLLAGRDNYQQCYIQMPVDNRNVFRPPVDCNFCRDVRQVDIVQHISPQDFESTYAYSGRPVIVKDAQANWTAADVFSYEFFSELYTKEFGGSSSARSRHQRCQFFPYKTEFRSLDEALTMGDRRKSERPWYFGWSNCDSQMADVLRRHYSRPDFLPERSESSRTDWIFMGTSGLGAHMHVDHVSLPSWQAQIRGQKLWSLEPPPECFYQCQSMEITVQPGDTSELLTILLLPLCFIFWGLFFNWINVVLLGCSRSGYQHLVPQDERRLRGCQHHHRLRVRLRNSVIST